MGEVSRGHIRSVVTEGPNGRGVRDETGVRARGEDLPVSRANAVALQAFAMLTYSAEPPYT